MYGGGAPSAADAAKQKIAAQQTMKNFAVSVATLYSIPFILDYVSRFFK